MCQYNFEQNGFCDVSFKLPKGSLIAVGAYNFNAPKFTLAVTGGTGAYRGVGGTVQVSAKGVSTQSQPVVRAAPMLQSLSLSFDMRGYATRGSRPRTLTIYSKPLGQAYAPNSDDEARGDVNNPFGKIDASAAALNGSPTDGPYAGDQALFAFNTYMDPKFGKKVGSSVYTCQYYFNRNGFCDASFQLPGGTLIGAGTLNFASPSFEFAITGGYGKYTGTTGDVVVSPLGSNTQRLVLTIEPS
jgi:hypothetical protein